MALLTFARTLPRGLISNMEELGKAAVLEQAMAEISHQWESTNLSKQRALHYKGVTELCQFLESCGIDVGREDKYELLLLLRSAGFKETKQDNEIKFLMWE